LTTVIRQPVNVPPLPGGSVFAALMTTAVAHAEGTWAFRAD
jgi:hypothetical protein